MSKKNFKLVSKKFSIKDSSLFRKYIVIINLLIVAFLLFSFHRVITLKGNSFEKSGFRLKIWISVYLFLFNVLLDICLTLLVELAFFSVYYFIQ